MRHISSYLVATTLGVAGFAALVVAQPARASILAFGSSFTLQGVNAPNSFTESDTLTLGTTTVDSGLLSLNVSTQAASGGEWDIFTFQTIGGGPIAGNLNSDWLLKISRVEVTRPSIFAQIYVAWGTNGTLFSPTTANGSNLPLETNPVTGHGNVYGGAINSLTTSHFTANGSANDFDRFLGQRNGFPVAQLNEFQLGVYLVPTPLPAAFPMFVTALGALGLLGWRRKSKNGPGANSPPAPADYRR